MKNKKIKNALIRAHFLCGAQLGIDPIKIYGFLRGLPRYLRDLSRFRSIYKGRLEWVPCLHDRHEEGGVTKSEYFWQDLLVAQKIFMASPKKHVDIGSRVDGFVAHLASFRKVEIFDIRPITTKIPGVTFRQVDFMTSLKGMKNYCDSLSCLHALEHFGLGRYGDPIDPDGWEKGLSNLAAILSTKGRLYLSVPVGVERVEFNANRIFDPRKIVQSASKNLLQLKNLTVIRQDGSIQIMKASEPQFDALADQRYALGVFTFEKRNRV